MKTITSKEKQYVSVVLTTWNSQGDISDILQWIIEWVWSVFEKFEIIIVDNASTDGTCDVVEKLVKKHIGIVTMIQLPWKHKKEYALQAGLDVCIWDFVYEIQQNWNFYKNNIFLELFNEVKKWNDIVAATPRKVTGFNKIFYSLLNAFTHLPFKLFTETMVFSSRRALNSALKYRQRAWVRKVMYKLSWFNVSTIYFLPRNKYVSQDTLSEKIRLALDLIFSFTHLGFSIPIGFAIIFSWLSLLLWAYSLYAYFFFSSVVEWWTTQMIFLSIGFSWIFLILWFISRYLAIVLSEVHHSANYTVKKIQVFNNH